MQLYTDEWVQLRAGRRDALMAVAIGGPASIKTFCRMIHGEGFSESQYVRQTRAFQDLVREGYIEQIDTDDGEHGNAKVHDITSSGELLLDRNVAEVSRRLTGI